MFDPTKVVRGSGETYRVATLPVGAIHHSRGEREHIQNSARVVHGAAHKRSRIGFVEIGLLIVNGFSLSGQEVGNLITSSSAKRQRVRSLIQDRLPALSAPAVNQILAEIARQVIGIIFVHEDTQFLSGVEVGSASVHAVGREVGGILVRSPSNWCCQLTGCSSRRTSHEEGRS